MLLMKGYLVKIYNLQTVKDKTKAKSKKSKLIQ